jgi:hypothetical protein
MTDTYERVMEMHPQGRERWIKSTLLYGLACSCKSGYCAKHDPRIIALLAGELRKQEEDDEE